jgi:DNA-binding NarL/FixJ family response regulator
MNDSSISVSAFAPVRLRILIADDHVIVRDGLRLLIGTQDDLELIAEAVNGPMALELARSLRPDVILMDLRMPLLHGTEVIHALTLEHPVQVLVMSSSEDSADVAAALRAGARGYLTKDAHHLEVLSAIRTVGRGGMVFGSAVTGGVMGSLQSRPSAQESPVHARQVFADLTDREFEVLEVLSGDFRNGEIAVRLGISEKTVRNHVSNILWKLKAKDRDEVVLKARGAGLERSVSTSTALGNLAGSNTRNNLESAGPVLEPINDGPPRGREREWAQLEAAWNAGLFTYITGPAGVGKTHLMRAFAASRGGEFIAFGGLPSDQAIPYASYARSIQMMLDRFPNLKLEPWVTLELQRILPKLRSNQPRLNQPGSNQPIYNNEEAKIRLCAAIVAIHVAVAPQLAGILVDDIQFFDAASAEVSMYTISSWKRFTGNAGEAPRFVACFQSGVFPPEIEAGIRQQAQVGAVALIDLELITPEPITPKKPNPVMVE